MIYRRNLAAVRNSLYSGSRLRIKDNLTFVFEVFRHQDCPHLIADGISTDHEENEFMDRHRPRYIVF